MNCYDVFLKLCDQKGVTASRALIDAGLSKSLGSKWKSMPTMVPNAATISKLAEYFHVSADVFLGTPESVASLLEHDLSSFLDGLSRTELLDLIELAVSKLRSR